MGGAGRRPLRGDVSPLNIFSQEVKMQKVNVPYLPEDKIVY